MITKDMLLIFFLIHMCFIDIKMWAEKKEPTWIESDWSYLGATFIFYIILAIYLGYAWNQIIYLGLLGSIAWDWVYGYYIDGDVLYPFKDWYGGWGFENKIDRAAFDAARLVFAIIFYFL